MYEGPKHSEVENGTRFGGGGWARESSVITFCPSYQASRGFSRAKVPSPLTGQVSTKHPDWVGTVPWGVDRLPHMAENQTEPSNHTLSSLPTPPTNWFT